MNLKLMSRFLCVNSIIFSISFLTYSESFDIKKDLVFRLYTREEPVMYYALNVAGGLPINATTFKSNRPTRIFVHGYKSKAKVLNRYSEAYLNAGDYNFIAVDWIEGASTINYFAAKNRVAPIAKKLAELLDLLYDNGMNLQDLLIVGHSLGSHIAGRAAKQIKSPGRIGIIVGLDPASVGFNFFERDFRLAETDADYVQVIHTDGDKFGFPQPMGHADFYPNGGQQQPGCPIRNRLTNLIEKCSHVRSHHLFLESLKTDLPAVQCISYEEISKNQCTFTNTVVNMGGDLKKDSTKPHGIFYLETKLEAPYAISDYRAFKNIEFIGLQ